jgi:hypothetical protein
MSKDDPPIIEVEPVEEKPKVEPVDQSTANTIEDLRINTVDPAAKVDPELGHKQFLKWQSVINLETGDLEFKAVGVDRTVYRIKEDKPPEPPKTFKLIIEAEKEPIEVAVDEIPRPPIHEPKPVVVPVEESKEDPGLEGTEPGAINPEPKTHGQEEKA